MITSKSPRKVLRLAHRLAAELLPNFRSKFSRKDYTGPPLFACLVLREHQKKSYRGAEALLIDREKGTSRLSLNPRLSAVGA